MNNLPTVTIGCPISNRKYLVNRYLDCLSKLDFPKENIVLYFLVNNCNDGTELELYDFKLANESLYSNIVIEKYKMPCKKDKRVTRTRLDIYNRLAELRNYLLSNIKTDYFFSVDSDILVYPNVLKELLNADKDIIAATINNDRIQRPYEDYPKIRTNLLIDSKYGITHYLDFPLNEVVEVDCTGAVYLMTKEVCQNVKYEFDKYGEDVPFCINAKKLGYKIFAHTGLWQEHIMCEFQDFCIDNKCSKPCVKIDNRTNVYQYRYIDNVVYPKLAGCGKLVKGEYALLTN